MTLEFQEKIRYTIIVVEDPMLRVPVPREVAVCPDCQTNLYALPDQFESLVAGIDLWRVFVPILECQSNDCNGAVTDEWLDIYETVADWFETILMKCGLASLLRH